MEGRTDQICSQIVSGFPTVWSGPEMDLRALGAEGFLFRYTQVPLLLKRDNISIWSHQAAKKRPFRLFNTETSLGFNV